MYVRAFQIFAKWSCDSCVLVWILRLLLWCFDLCQNFNLSVSSVNGFIFLHRQGVGCWSIIEITCTNWTNNDTYQAIDWTASTNCMFPTRCVLIKSVVASALACLVCTGRCLALRLHHNALLFLLMNWDIAGMERCNYLFYWRAWFLPCLLLIRCHFDEDWFQYQLVACSCVV